MIKPISVPKSKLRSVGAEKASWILILRIYCPVDLQLTLIVRSKLPASHSLNDCPTKCSRTIAALPPDSRSLNYVHCACCAWPRCSGMNFILLVTPAAFCCPFRSCMCSRTAVKKKIDCWCYVVSIALRAAPIARRSLFASAAGRARRSDSSAACESGTRLSELKCGFLSKPLKIWQGLRHSCISRRHAQTFHRSVYSGSHSLAQLLQGRSVGGSGGR
jgi:hypothetical protein